MNPLNDQAFLEQIRAFRLPRFDQIPDVGLYLEQATKYIGTFLTPLGDFTLTSSMISNYVKKGLIPSPVKKRYSREQIAYLFFIAVAKSVLSLDALAGFLALQRRTYPLDKAYNYFCEELENILQFTFEVKDTLDIRDEDASLEKRLLYTCIAAAAQKIYLERNLEAIAAGSEAS